MAMTPEGKFQKDVLKRLKQIPNCYYHKHQAGSIRGIADVIGCLNGKMFALELKKDYSSTQATTGRIVLQKHVLGLITKAGGFARLSCPQTIEQDMIDLIEFSTS